MKKYHKNNKMKFVNNKQSRFHFPLVASTLVLWSITVGVPSATARKSPKWFPLVKLHAAWQEALYDITNYSHTL